MHARMRKEKSQTGKGHIESLRPLMVTGNVDPNFLRLTDDICAILRPGAIIQIKRVGQIGLGQNAREIFFNGSAVRGQWSQIRNLCESRKTQNENNEDKKMFQKSSVILYPNIVST